MWFSTVTAGRLLRVFMSHEIGHIPWLTETLIMELQTLTRVAVLKTSPGLDPHSYSVSTLTFWHRSFTFNSNKSPTWCNNFSVYYPDVCLQLNVLRTFSRPSSGAPWLQWQPMVLPSYRGDSSAVGRGHAGRPDHEHSTIITRIRR
jgi:hypothetical protein